MSYQPKTGARCGCRRGIERDNCPACEGTGLVIDFVAIRARRSAPQPKSCGHCGATDGRCPECGKVYPHGTASHCTESGCIRHNAPVDCRCGFVVSADLAGVLDLDMQLIPWEED